MKTLGRHLLGEFYQCEPTHLDDPETLERWLVQAAEQVGATVLARCFHRYAPQGVSGAVIIAESHLSLHTWPEARYVAVDLFTCGGLDPRPGLITLGTALGAKQFRQHEVARGLPEEFAGAVLPSDVVVLCDEAPLLSLCGERPSEAPDQGAGKQIVALAPRRSLRGPS